MTRGPAKPISAFGSAMFRSPSIAKLAVTPPVVGSVSTEMYGSRARSSRASAPQIFAICISDSAPSIMRAPPEQQTMTTGMRPSIARSIARVIFSPTTTPMLPPMKAYSIDATIVWMPSIAPDADDDGVLQAGRSRCSALRRALYGLVSVNDERIGRDQILVVLGPLAVEQHAQALGGADPEVMRALRADVEVGREILVVDDLRAAGTLDPQPFGHAARLLLGRAAIGLRVFLNQAISSQLISFSSQLREP